MIKAFIIAMVLLLQSDPLVKPIELESHVRTVLFGDITKPKRLTTLKEASDTLGATCANALCNQIKFETHDILLFEWSGSGRDEIIIYSIRQSDLSPLMGGGGMCIFKYERGRTRDARQHTQAFSIPNDMSYKVMK